MQKAELWKIAILAGVGGLVGSMVSGIFRGTAIGSMILWLCGLAVLGFIAYVIWTLLFKNKSLTKGSQAQKAEALQFRAEPNMGVIYLCRKQYIAVLVGMDVVMDGQLMGQTRGYCFYRFVVNPGTHTLSGDKKCQDTLSVNVVAGEIVYVEKEMLMGMMKGGYHYIINSNMVNAQDKIRACKLLLPSPAAK
jgi:hypothetical protein